jgi:Tfp pilus assembly protein PilO
MWTNVMILLILVLFFIAKELLKQKEGFDNPYTESQQQQGDIATLKKQLSKITISDASLTDLQNQITELSDNTSTLQKNVPDGQVQKYALD